MKRKYTTGAARVVRYFDCFTWLWLCGRNTREAIGREISDVCHALEECKRGLIWGNMVSGQATSFSCLFSLHFGETNFVWA